MRGLTLRELAVAVGASLETVGDTIIRAQLFPDADQTWAQTDAAVLRFLVRLDALSVPDQVLRFAAAWARRAAPSVLASDVVVIVPHNVGHPIPGKHTGGALIEPKLARRSTLGTVLNAGTAWVVDLGPRADIRKVLLP